MCALLQSVPPTLQQATANPLLCRRLLNSHGQAWVSLLWCLCFFLLGPGAPKVLFVPSESLFPQSCESSGSSMAGLMATFSKRAYVVLKSAAPRTPVPVAVHWWPIPPQETLKHSSAPSLWGLWVLVHTRFVWTLWASLAGMGFDSKCNFTPPTIFLGLLLCPWTGGISSQVLQCYSVTATERFSVSNIKVTGNK